MDELIILISLSFEGAIEFFVGLLLRGGGTGIDEMFVSFSEYCSRFKFNSTFILSMVLFVIGIGMKGGGWKVLMSFILSYFMFVMSVQWGLVFG